MLLSKITRWRETRLWKDYAAWLVFCAVLLNLTNAAASLNKIQAYGFQTFDGFLTFGFLIFWGCLEAAVVAALLTLAQVWLEKITHTSLNSLFRVLVIAAFATSWIILLFTILRLV